MVEQDFNSIISVRIKHYLSINDMTQLELARHLNVSDTAVSNWIQGKKTPRMDKVDAMCKLFSCKRSDLMELPNAESLVALTADPEMTRHIELMQSLPENLRECVFEIAQIISKTTSA
jgi:transcriptional regulator with XRE-family HTH domain